VIQSWKGKVAEAVFRGEVSKGFPAHLFQATRRRLAQLDAAASINDLRSPPSNRLHRLVGDRKGHWSIRINDQFRLCFRWDRNGPEDVEFADYH
jgi:proteic killer suppression protein